MTNTKNRNLMPHRPSRGVTTGVALLAASSKAIKRKQAIADTSLLSFSHIRSSPPPHLINDNLSIDPSIRTDSSIPPDFRLASVSSSHDFRHSALRSTTIFRPRVPVYMAAFNVRTLKQAGQQAALALTRIRNSYPGCKYSD